jgi:hypothetical protein
MNDTTHPADTIAFETLCEIIETDYVIREQEGRPAPSSSNETLYMFAHNLRATIRLAFDLGIIEAGRAGFPVPGISAFAADQIKRTEAEDANGIGYWDTVDLTARGSMARVLCDRVNLALDILSRKFRMRILPEPPAEQARSGVNSTKNNLANKSNNVCYSVASRPSIVGPYPVRLPQH